MDLETILAACLSNDQSIRSQAEATLAEFTTHLASFVQLFRRLELSPQDQVRVHASYHAIVEDCHSAHVLSHALMR